MPSLPPDQTQRAQALDTQHSFIVQAPAGSGKTALLVERYLRLLLQVNAPEKIVVLTFTKKATQEMKERILAALQPDSQLSESLTHQFQQNSNLKQKLRDWQLKQGWNLIREPHRLRIQTIDAFYAQLVHNAFGSMETHHLVKDPTLLYETAIQQLFFECGTTPGLAEACSEVMRCLNNDSTRVERLLLQMLFHREQWIDTLKQGAYQLETLRTTLENTLSHICQQAYQAMEKELNAVALPDWYQALHQLLVDTKHLTPHGNDPHVFWSALTELLLTKQDQWRRIIPNQWTNHYSPSDQKALKKKIKYWLTTFQNHHSLLKALVAIKYLPASRYTELQWEFVRHLFHLLKALITILDYVFDTNKRIDYIGISLKAESALGMSLPNALLLELDTKIEHLLIDEFQDTSLQQIKFFNRLTEGWQPNDGRTLFLVGDPMQSIYRFRKADARLFQWVKEKGLGSCQPQCVSLSSNFRATKPLVQWVNQHFQAIQGLTEKHFQTSEGFSHSVAFNLTETDKEAVHTYWLDNADESEEASVVLKCIQEIMDQNSSLKGRAIAVLARAREHLIPIMYQLKRHHLPYQAIDVETLFDQPIVRDLLMLTRSIAHVNDDIAWLSLLRAPWCGLTLADLQCIKAKKDRNLFSTLWDQIKNIETSDLSSDGIQRVIRLKTALEPGMNGYGRHRLPTLILDTWHRLQGPLTQPKGTWHLSTVQRFCECLDRIQMGAMLTDISALEKLLKTTYTHETEALTAPPIVLMTIHKAKGLEFDYVILPGLHRVTRNPSQAIMLVDEQISVTGKQLLLAPITAADASEADPIYRYLYRLEVQQSQMEAIRVLYVACTRAKKQLHLIASIRKDRSDLPLPPAIGSFLYWLWPTFSDHQKQLQRISTTLTQPDKQGLYLKRFRIDT